MPITLRSSTMTTAWFWLIVAETLWRKSARQSAIFRWSRASRFRALARFLDPVFLRERKRWRRMSRAWCRERKRGESMTVPSERVANRGTPRSSPTITGEG